MVITSAYVAQAGGISMPPVVGSTPVLESTLGPDEPVSATGPVEPVIPSVMGVGVVSDPSAVPAVVSLLVVGVSVATAGPKEARLERRHPMMGYSVRIAHDEGHPGRVEALEALRDRMQADHDSLILQAEAALAKRERVVAALVAARAAE